MAGSGFIALMIFIFVVVIPCFVYGLLWGTNTLCDKTDPSPQTWTGMNCASVYEMSGGSPGTTGSGSNTPIATPQETLLASGQSLYVGPTDLKTAWNPAGIPVSPGTIAGSGPVTYTLSFFINPSAGLKAAGSGWANVFLRGTAATNQTNRCPGIWLTAGTTKLTVIHSGTVNTHDNGTETSELAVNTWSHIVVVVNNNVMMIYVNGVLNKTYTATDPFVWGTSTNGWINHGTSTNPGATGDWAKPISALQVKDYYWFTKALTPAEVSILASTGTTGTPGTTSTYVSEPVYEGITGFANKGYMMTY